jgi:hypothetical protein
MNAVAKKLLMKPGQHWLLFNAPDTYLAALEPLPDGLQISLTIDAVFDGIQLFALNSAELATGLLYINEILTAKTVLWVIYPKKTSGMVTDLEMMGNWTEPNKYGLNGVAAAAIDDTWTALRFRPEGQSKTSATSNSQLSSGQYAAYIDVANKNIVLPTDVEAALQQQPEAFTFYSKLSYSNKKEYLLWILTTKQEKTRTERLVKMVVKLLSGKKNPSQK